MLFARGPGAGFDRKFSDAGLADDVQHLNLEVIGPGDRRRSGDDSRERRDREARWQRPRADRPSTATSG